MKNVLISASILSANLLEFKKDITSVLKAKTDWLHVDVMDGAFVPPITFGDNIVKSLKLFTNVFLDVHLMIENPENQIENFIKAGANLITIHYESFKNKKKLKEALLSVKKLGVKVGLSIKPKTDTKKIFEFLPLLDLVLIMSVEPGYAGQKFISSALEKISVLKKEILKQNLKTLIEVDGGVNDITGKKCIEKGVDVLVAGTYIFKSENRKEAIFKLKNF